MMIGLMWKKSQTLVFLYLFNMTAKLQPIWRYLTFHERVSLGKYTLLRKSKEVNLYLYKFQYKLIPSLVTGDGDVAYNSRRGILSAIPLGGKVAYHLFKIDSYPSKIDDTVKLCRKSKRHSQYSICTLSFSLKRLFFWYIKLDSSITGYDFNMGGEIIAAIAQCGVCLISDVNTNNYSFHLNMDMKNQSGNLWYLVYSSCYYSLNESIHPPAYLNLLIRFFQPLQMEHRYWRTVPIH